MINSLEELYKKVSEEELIDLFEKCLSKSKSEIIEVFKEKGYEINDDLASECKKCYESIVPIDDSDLACVAGGSTENGCLPGSARIALEIAIKGLEKYKTGATLELIIDIAQGIIDDLKDLMARPYDKIPFKNELTQIEIRVGFLPLVKNNGKDIALEAIAEAQRITHLES